MKQTCRGGGGGNVLLTRSEVCVMRGYFNYTKLGKFVAKLEKTQVENRHF